MKIRLSRIALAVTASTACIAPVHANFMDDFFTAAGAAANVTPGGIVKGQGGTFITGGSATWHVPTRSFTPFLWQAPSLKAGCGGIDFFGGSFGFASSTDFVNYLRNIGQNSIGLMFKIALKAMAPDLDATMKEISEDIQRMNNYLGNSCQMAKNLTGPLDKWVDENLRSSTNQSTANGTTPGIYDAYTTMKTNLSAMIGVSLPPAQASNSGGSPTGKPERNTTWLALNSGALANMNWDYFNIGMSMLGTKVYRKGSADDLPQLTPYERRPQLLEQLAGRWSSGVTSVQVLDCGTDPTQQCLSPTLSSVNFKPAATKAYEALTLLRNAILNRQDVLSVAGGPDAMSLLGTTRLPVYKVLALTSSPGMAGLSDLLLQRFSDLMGMEMAVAFVATIANDLEQTISKSDNGGLQEEDVRDLKQRLNDARQDIRAVQAALIATNGSQADLIAEVEHMERSFYSSFNLRLMDNVRYAMRQR